MPFSMYTILQQFFFKKTCMVWRSTLWGLLTFSSDTSDWGRLRRKKSGARTGFREDTWGQTPPEKRGSLSSHCINKANLTYSADGLSCHEVPSTKHILMYRIFAAAGFWRLEIHFTDLTVNNANLSFLQLEWWSQEICRGLGVGERSDVGWSLGRRLVPSPICLLMDMLPVLADRIGKSLRGLQRWGDKTFRTDKRVKVGRARREVYVAAVG